ncbi:hypothetical protein D3C72_1674010 [compost metagenome]
MLLRLFSLVATALALTSCVDGGFSGGTRQFSGVWLMEFEGSAFVEGATQIPKVRPAYDASDAFEFTDWPQLEGLMEPSLSNRDCYTVQPFLVTFVGRRTHHPFTGAGHLGLWRTQVTVQRPISAKRLGPSFCYDG